MYIYHMYIPNQEVQSMLKEWPAATFPKGSSTELRGKRQNLGLKDGVGLHAGILFWPLFKSSDRNHDVLWDCQQMLTVARISRRVPGRS